jgi:hypothetical protein
MSPAMLALQIGDYKLAWEVVNGASREQLCEVLRGGHRMEGYSAPLSSDLQYSTP